MSEWFTATVADLQDAGVLLVEDGTHGEYRPRREEFSDVGVAFIRAADMTSGRVLFKEASRINEAAFCRIRKGIGQPGDVLLSHKGTVGKVARTPIDAPLFVCSPQTTFYRSLDSSVLDPVYLFFYLQSPNFQRQLESRKGETDMADYVSLTGQRRLTVLLPSLVEQRAIAEVLGALDDKIEANRRHQDLLESLVRAKVRHLQEAATYPVLLGDVVQRISQVVQPTCLDGDTAYIGLEHMPRGSLILNEHGWANDLESAKARFERHDVLFGKLRPYFKKVAIAPCSGVCSTDILVLRPRGPDWAVAAAACASEDVIEYASAGADGTRMPRVSWDYLARYEVRLPSEGSRNALQKLLAPLLELAMALTEQCNTLAQVRETVLPKLLSGELRVRDAESLVQEAV